MRTQLKVIVLFMFFIVISAVKAQTYVETAPAGNQTITQPTSTALNLNGSATLNLNGSGGHSSATITSGVDDLLLQANGDTGQIVLDASSGAYESGSNVSVLLTEDSGGSFLINDTSTPITFFCAGTNEYISYGVGIGDSGNSCSPYDLLDVSDRETFGDGYMHWFASGAAYSAWNAGISNPSTGVFSFDTTTDGNALASIKAAIVSAGTGFAIPGHTTTGHYLRNNGTNYVDSAISPSDLTGVVFTAPAANQTVTSGGYTISWNSAASLSSTDIFIVNDSSTAAIPAKYYQSGHLVSIQTAPTSNLDPFGVYMQETPDSGQNHSNATFEVTRLEDIGDSDRALIRSQMNCSGTGGYGTYAASCNHYTTSSFYTGMGSNFGPSGTKLTGWTSSHQYKNSVYAYVNGITSGVGGTLFKFAQGDTIGTYELLTAHGGRVTAADEGVNNYYGHTYQAGYMTATVSGNPGTGATTPTFPSGVACHPGLLASGDACPGYHAFSDGAIAFDSSKSTGTLNITGVAFDSTLNSMYATVTGTAPAVSTAWGNLVVSSCDPSTGYNETYNSVQCNVLLGSGSGYFVAGSDVFLSGPFEEEAAVTAVGAPSGGHQTVKFSTRKAWDGTGSTPNTNAAIIAQGGIGGQSFVVTSQASTWPIAYWIVGYFNSRLYYANCRSGSACNGLAQAYGAFPIPNPSLFSSGHISRSGGTVTFTTGAGNAFAIYMPTVGSQVVASGWTPSDLNGTFTVVSNSMDITNPILTWMQSGTTETSSGAVGTLGQAPTGITLYPSAFTIEGNPITTFATNTIPFTNGDVMVDAPTAEENQQGYVMWMGQQSPNTESDSGYSLNDTGPVPVTNAFQAYQATNVKSPGGSVLYASGSYGNIIDTTYRPANNGAVLYVFGENPVPGVSNIPYYVFKDASGGGSLLYTPSTNGFGFYGYLSASSTSSTIPAVSGVNNFDTTTPVFAASNNNSYGAAVYASYDATNSDALVGSVGFNGHNNKTFYSVKGNGYAVQISTDPLTLNADTSDIGYWQLANSSNVALAGATPSASYAVVAGTSNAFTVTSAGVTAMAANSTAGGSLLCTAAGVAGCPVNVPNIQITVGTTTVPANSCLPTATTYSTATMTGLTSTMTINSSWSADYSAVTGWSPAGTRLYFTSYPTANTLHYQVCNNSGSAITPSSSTVWNVSAK